MLIEICMLCHGDLKPASEGKLNHIYADYYYDEENKEECEAGVYICPECKFVLADTRYWDGPHYSVSFAYNDKFLDNMHTMIPERAFEAGNKNDPEYKKLLKRLPEIKERIQKVKKGEIKAPLE